MTAKSSTAVPIDAAIAVMVRTLTGDEVGSELTLRAKVELMVEYSVGEDSAIAVKYERLTLVYFSVEYLTRLNTSK